MISDTRNVFMKVKYDLEIRTNLFAKQVRKFVNSVEKRIYNIDDIKQLIRSSGSVAANYIEANESLSTKDFLYRLRICRKEIKESRLWIDLIISTSSTVNSNEFSQILNECIELEKIFGAIILKCEKKA